MGLSPLGWKIFIKNTLELKKKLGPVLVSSKYTNRELRALAKKIKKWHKQNKDVYVYFNNDAFGHAIENARTLKALLK